MLNMSKKEKKKIALEEPLIRLGMLTSENFFKALLIIAILKFLETAVKTTPTKYEGGLRRLIFNLQRQVLSVVGAISIAEVFPQI